MPPFLHDDSAPVPLQSYCQRLVPAHLSSQLIIDLGQLAVLLDILVWIPLVVLIISYCFHQGIPPHWYDQ
jgi:hypothetical protein